MSPKHSQVSTRYVTEALTGLDPLYSTRDLQNLFVKITYRL